jgi:hypothetical protein
LGRPNQIEPEGNGLLGSFSPVVVSERRVGAETIRNWVCGPLLLLAKANAIESLS